MNMPADDMSHPLIKFDPAHWRAVTNEVFATFDRVASRVSLESARHIANLTLDLFKSGTQFTCICCNPDVASGAGESALSLEPSDELLAFAAALRALECDLLVIAERHIILR